MESMAKISKKRNKYRPRADRLRKTGTGYASSRNDWEGSRQKPLGEVLRQHGSLLVVASLILVLGAALTLGYRYMIRNYTVTTIYVDGNIHYTDEQIMELIMKGKYDNNSLLLSLKYKDKSIVGIPFIEKMDVSILEKDTIRINVYEKAIAGYVEYLGHFLYFDKDGIIVENSLSTTPGIPQVTGLEFGHAIMYEKLPVENENIFSRILSLSQLLNHYEVKVDKLFFSDSDEVILTIGKVRIALGNESFIDEKVMELQNILPSLEGKSGILRLDNYDEFTHETIFEADL